MTAPTNPSELWSLLREDFATHDRDWTQPGFWALASHRVGTWTQSWRSQFARTSAQRAYAAITRATQPLVGFELPLETRLGRRVRFWHHGGTRIFAKRVGDDVHLRQNTLIGPADPRDTDPRSWPELGDRVDVGSGACVRGAIQIGDDALVGANSFVNSNAPARSTVVGVPARALPRMGKPRFGVVSDLPEKGTQNQNPAELPLLELVAEDFRTHGSRTFEPGFWAVAIHRFGNWRMSVQNKALRAPLTLAYRVAFHTVRQVWGIDLPYDVQLGRRVRLAHHGSIHIGARSIGDDVIIRHGATIGLARAGQNEPKPIVANRVEIGPRACIVGNVTIGEDAVIGANTVVPIDVPPGTFALGVPARFVKPARLATEPPPSDATNPRRAPTALVG